MMIADELQAYARSCLDDTIPSCTKHKWACKRFLDDMERAENDPSYPYYWDDREAELISDWFLLLRHSKGVLAGQEIRLTPSQKFTVCQIYGWRRKDTKLRRFTKLFKEVARKNAKSQELAGILLYEISRGAVKNGEIYETYCAGSKKDQSLIIISEAWNMLTKSPLKPKFKKVGNMISHKKSGSFMKALSKNDRQSGDGSNPAVLCLDEYHQHRTTEFYDLFLGANTKEPLLLIITTAGTDLNTPCYRKEYTYCSSVLNPYVDITNEEYLIDIYEAENEERPGDTNEWKKANPIRMYYPEGVEKIKSAYALAKDIPEEMTSFMTKMLNIWLQRSEDGYMDMAKWKACEVKEIPVSLKNRAVFVGFDMSAKIDLTSVAFMIPFMDGIIKKYVLFSHSFVPNRDKLMEHKRVDKVPYDAWERAGYITVTNTEIVDQNCVMNYVTKTCEENGWNIECLCFDPANASKLMMDLSNEGYDVEEVFQSYRSLNESTAGFREQVYEKNIFYLPNPVLNFAMSNAVVRKNNGLIKIDKDASDKRIDPVDAALCAFKLALYYDCGQSSFDEEKWLESDEW